VRMNGIGQAGAKGFLQFESSHRGPGRIEEGATASFIYLKNNFLNSLDDRLIFEFAGAEGVGGSFALNAQSDAVGYGAHFLKGGFGEWIAGKERHQPDDTLLQDQWITGEGDNALPPGPGLIDYSRVIESLVNQNRFSARNVIHPQVHFGLRGRVFFYLAHWPCAGLKPERLFLGVKNPNSRQGAIQIPDHGLGASLQDGFKGIALSQGEADIRAKS